MYETLRQYLNLAAITRAQLEHADLIAVPSGAVGATVPVLLRHLPAMLEALSIYVRPDMLQMWSEVVTRAVADLTCIQEYWQAQRPANIPSEVVAGLLNQLPVEMRDAVQAEIVKHLQTQLAANGLATISTTGTVQMTVPLEQVLAITTSVLENVPPSVPLVQLREKPDAPATDN
jgi:hypothetical protein